MSVKKTFVALELEVHDVLEVVDGSHVPWRLLVLNDHPVHLTSPERPPGTEGFGLLDVHLLDERRLFGVIDTGGQS